MFKVFRSGNDRIDIEFGGKLNSDDMRAAIDDLVTKTEGIEQGKMMYEISDFHIPTLGAMGVELSRMPALFKMIGKFDRAAVLVDQDWLQKVSEIEGALIPGIEIKAFDRDEKLEAEAWLEGITEFQG